MLLTLTLDHRLSYAGDTSGLTPTVSADRVVWQPLALASLESRSFEVGFTSTPALPVGSRYPITVTLSTEGPEADPTDNSSISNIVVPWTLRMPEVHR